MWAKAVALLQSLFRNRALVDSNKHKRLGWLATGTILELNGLDITKANNDAVYKFDMSVAAVC